MNRLRIKHWILVLVLLGAVGTGGFYLWRYKTASGLLSRAKESLEKQDYQKARVYSFKALEIWPDHPESLLVYAEAVFKDETVPDESKIEFAINALEKIPDESNVGTEARIREASIYFFNLLQPSNAKRSLNRALAISGDRLDVLQSLMQIYCCTGRQTFSENLFKRMVSAAKNDDEKLDVLSSWFLSQFSLNTYNSGTDQQLGISGIYSANIPLSQKRLLAFRANDPDGFLLQVALANWFYLRNDANHAKQLLDEIDPDKIDLSEPLYLMTAVNVYLEVGETELAQQLHGYWKDKYYFEYWRQKGVIQQDYQNDFAGAAQSFEKALTVWPGHIDPSVYFRLETCWKALGDSGKSEEFRQRGEKMRNTTAVARIKELQTILLGKQFTVDNCKKFAKFYLDIERDFEAEQWEALTTTVE